MTNDYAKKEESSGRMRVRPSKGSRRKAEEEDSDEEENEKSDEEDYVPSEVDSENDDESFAGSAASSSEEDREESPAKSLAGMKRKKEVKKSKNEQRKRTRQDENNNDEDMEVKHVSIRNRNQEKETRKESKNRDKEENSKNKDKEENSKNKEDNSKEAENEKKGKKETPIFNDRNVDLDLFNSSPNNVIAKKVKVANNLIVTCRNIDQIEGGRGAGLSYDFAALTFQRKTANDKMFEFVVPLALAPAIKNAIDHIIEKNPKFFSGH